MCAIPLAPMCGARTIQTTPATPSIHARLEFPTIGDGKPTGLLAADLDGDGRSELIGITTGPGAVQIWSRLDARPKQWPEPRAIPIDDFALGPVWLGGTAPAKDTARAEIVFASRAKPGISVLDVRAAWKAKPDETMSPVWHLDLAQRPRVLASGDLGLDKKPEIALITVDDDLSIVRSPSDVVTTHLSDTQATCALFAADGKSLYVGFQATRRLVRYTFDAQSKPVEAGAVQLDGLPRAIDEIASDKGPLIVVAGGDEALWRFTLKDGSFVAQKKLDGGSIPFALVQGSANAAGTPWIAIARQGQEAVAFASATSDAPTFRLYAGQHPQAAALGDFDGDGAIDLAVANGEAKRVSVLFGDGRGGFDVAPGAAAGRAPHALAVGDLDGDKHLDVVALSALEGTLSVLRNRDGKIAAQEVQGIADSADAVQLADLDGDGHLDAAFLRRTSAGCEINAFFGDGKGHLFQRAEVIPARVGASSGDLLLADVDGDGIVEAIVADPEGGKVAIVSIERVTGAGCKFGAPRAIEVPSGPRALALIDAEGDTNPEIAVALAGPGPRLGVAILRVVKGGDGALTLQEVRTIPRDRAVLSIAAGDFDRNGLTDLALLVSKSESDNQLAIAYQSKDREWSVPPADLPTGLRPYVLRTADVDGDGSLDLLCSAQNSHHVNLWLNGGGSPVYFARAADIGAGTGPLDIEVADLDGDGHLSILVANAFSDDVSTIRVR
jgi:hypothetical protein